MELSQIKGIGKTRLEALRAAGICSLRDLLYSLPAGYKDTTVITPCAELQPGQYAAVRGGLKAAPKTSYFRGLCRVTARLCDESGSIALVWYNQPWMAQNLPTDGEVLLYGRIEEKSGKKYMNSPSVEEEEKITAVYRAIPGVPAKLFASMVNTALEEIDDCCPETLPRALRMRYGLCEKNYAVRQVHQPIGQQELQLARRRLSFEQLLFYQALLARRNNRKETGIAIPCVSGDAEAFWGSMPFRPTGAQDRALKQVLSDMAAAFPMARLVQGDVGCGKTAVAFGALYAAVRHGFQGVMMAPTEILARQHYESALKTFEPLGIRCGLLLGGMKARERREALANMADGTWQVIIGTHALISEGVQYAKLGLCITDEQHRFGVRQRTALSEKGREAPNVLVMSATPIPRTLALILYGDLDVSVIDELPAGRQPVKTRIVPDAKRDSMYAFLREQASQGRQAYVVCPLVEDSDSISDVKSAQTEYHRLVAGPLKGLTVGLTYGKQPEEEKQQVLTDFAAGKIQVLVATTVIEVGINVPNATVMVIENAERFGLSQLHQLRGRVGRGSEESWCLLLADSNERLRTMVSTNDGFVIAQKDLELRGPGEFLGTRQHGEAVLPGGTSLYGDVRLLEETHQCMKQLLQTPSMKNELDAVMAEAEKALGEKMREIALN